MTSRHFDRLFGGVPRKPESPMRQVDMDLARSVQDVIEIVLGNMARFARKETGASKLCLAGGVALNCVANSKVLSQGLFEDIWIQPAAGDAGGALGAALGYGISIWGTPGQTSLSMTGKKDRTWVRNMPMLIFLIF